MPKGKKRPRGTTMGDVLVEMSNMERDDFSETSATPPIQPPNLLFSNTQARFHAHLQTQLQQKTQSLSKSLHVSKNQPLPGTNSQSNSSGTGLISKLSKVKKGRGPAKLCEEWDSGKRLEVTLNEEGDVIGVATQYNKYISTLGALARIGTYLPLHYISWSYMPDEKLDAIWNNVQVNTTLPNEARSIVLNTLNNMWRDWKRRLKDNYFTPYIGDPNHDFSQLPNEQIELDQWLLLVQYWKKKPVKEQAIQNAKNRAKKKYQHHTGKTPFPLIKEEMRQEGKEVTKLDLFLLTRQGANVDPETAALCNVFNEALLKKPESERTKEYKDELFVNGTGEDPHGRRCTGTRSKLKKSHLINIQTTPIVGQIEELRRLKDEVTHGRNEVEQMKLELIKEKEELSNEKERMVVEVRKDFKDQLDTIKVSMDFVLSLINPSALQSALSRGNAPGIKAISALCGINEPRKNNDDNIIEPQEQSQDVSTFSTSNEIVGEHIPKDTGIDDYIPAKVTNAYSKQNDFYDCSPVEVGSIVMLFCSELPKKVVAEGVLLSMDPDEKIDDIALGHEFVKVAIKKANEPGYLLIRPRRGVSNVQQAVGKSVAWEYVDVMVK